MNVRLLLTISAIYMGVLGLGFILVPHAIGIGAVPPDPSPALTAYLRILGSPFLGIAALNWTARNLAPSPTHKGILLANLVGFGVAGLLDVWGLFNGARQLAKVFLVVHLLFALGFVLAWRRTMSARPA